MLIGFLVALNIVVIYVLMALPLGVKTTTARRVIAAPSETLFAALWPLGEHARWSGEVVSCAWIDRDEGLARLVIAWTGRDGKPIERVVRLIETGSETGFEMTVVDDDSLDPAFWAHYHETTELRADGRNTEVVLSRTDRYRGAAFLGFRYFAMRRQLAKLAHWAETGEYRSGGWFEHPATQFGFAGLSTLILWPVFGLDIRGFIFAITLTIVVGLHEFGHLAAFRLMGHRRVRMIFIPLLGGVAIGGRPYDSRFEVAFVALMGAGFSAFLAPIAMAASLLGTAQGNLRAAGVLAVFAGLAALFNLANLVPVWKFDGGQVLRQILPDGAALAAASFCILALFMWVGWVAGFSPRLLLVGGAVLAVLSLMTAGSGVKPRRELKPISGQDKLAVAAAYLAVFAIHGTVMIWAAARIA